MNLIIKNSCYCSVCFTIGTHTRVYKNKHSNIHKNYIHTCSTLDNCTARTYKSIHYRQIGNLVRKSQANEVFLTAKLRSTWGNKTKGTVSKIMGILNSIL